MPDASRSTGPLIGEADDTITRDSRVPSHLQGAAKISGAYWTSGKMHSQTFAGCPDEQIGLEMMIDLTTFAFAQSVNPEFTLH